MSITNTDCERRLEPDRTDLANFIRTMYMHAAPGNYVSLRSFLDDGKEGPPIRITGRKLNGNIDLIIDAAVKDARFAANHSKAVVFSPIVATFDEEKKAAETNLV